jgi:hypothetical protein
VDRATGGNVWTQAIDASQLHQLTHFTDGRIIDDFAWSQDAERLAVARSAAANDKRAETHEAFLSLGCALICCRSLRRLTE